MKVSLKEPRNFKFGLPLIHIKELMLALFTLQIFFFKKKQKNSS